MATEQAAIVEELISAFAWARIPGLKSSVLKFVELAAGEVPPVLISAAVIDSSWLSIRVTRSGPGGEPGDWVEWLTPSSFIRGNQAALDHYACHQMRIAVRRLASRSGSSPTLRDLTNPVDDEFPIPEERGESMARTKSETKPAELPPADPPEPTRAKPGPKPGKAAAKPAATETMAKPGRKPKAAKKAARKAKV